MHTRHVFWPLLLVVLLAIAVPVQAQPWSITVLNTAPIVAGSNMTFNVTGDPTTPFHLRVSLDGTSIARIPEFETLSLPETGEMLVNWSAPDTLSSGNYTVEVYLDPQEVIIRVPDTVQAGDYLLSAKIQKGFGMTCDTTGDPGWNELFQISWTSTFGTYFFKTCQNIADADDAGTIGGLQGDAVIYAIRGHTLNGANPEFQTSFNAGTIAPNPPSLFPSYPNYLAIAVGVAATDSVGAILSLFSPPDGYGDVVVDNLDNQYLTTFGSKAGLSGAENPSLFNVNCDGICDQVSGWGAATIAIPDGVTFEPVVATTTLNVSILSTDDHQELVLEQLLLDIEWLKLAIAEIRAEMDQLNLNQSEMNTRIQALELIVDDLEKKVAELERLMGERPPITPPVPGIPVFAFGIIVGAFVLSIVSLVVTFIAYRGRD